MDYAGKRGEVKLVTDFEMEGRSLLTARTCGQGISALVEALQQKVFIDRHPLQITMARGGRNLMRITIRIEEGQPVTIGNSRALSISGTIFPSRRFDYEPLRQNLKDMIATLRDKDPTSGVPEGFSLRTGDRGVHIYLTLKPGRSQRPIGPVTYGSIIRILQTVKNFYNIRNYGVYLFGEMMQQGQEIGYLLIEEDTSRFQTSAPSIQGISGGNATGFQVFRYNVTDPATS